MITLPTTVYATAEGLAYHETAQCPSMANGQLLSDTDCGCDTYCNHRMPRVHAVREMTATDAAAQGKWPCVYCFHLTSITTERVPLPACTETFGHEPVDEYAGTPEGVRGVSRIICARCVTWTRMTDIEVSFGVRVTWPCTSAIVLGLVPRPYALLEGE